MLSVDGDALVRTVEYLAAGLKAAQIFSLQYRRFSTCAGVWTFFTSAGLVRLSLGLTRAKGPAHISLGQRPRSRAPTNNPKRHRRGPISEIIERGMLVPHRASKPFSGVSKKNTGGCRQAWDRTPRGLCLGLKWNALSALWLRPSDYPAPWAGLV